jgi:hypothetical protein
MNTTGLKLILLLVAISSFYQDKSDPLLFEYIRDGPIKVDQGYFYTYDSISINKREFIFSMNIRKRAYMQKNNRFVMFDHKKTLTTNSGFVDTFQSGKYVAILTVNNMKKIDDAVMELRGTLEIKYGSKSKKIKVRGMKII